MEILEEKGAQVDYNDPLIPVLPKMRMYHVGHKESVDLTAENLKNTIVFWFLQITRFTTGILLWKMLS